MSFEELPLTSLVPDQAPVPLRLFSDVMTLHWHNMSAKCQNCWNCVPLTPVTLCWHFPVATDVSKCFIGRAGLTHIAAVGNNHFVHCDVTGRSRQVSTSMFFECLILIFQQTRNISIKRKCLSMPFKKYTMHVLWLFSLIFTKSQLLVECQRPNVMRLMSWHLTQNVMRFAVWDGKPMSWL